MTSEVHVFVEGLRIKKQEHTSNSLVAFNCHNTFPADAPGCHFTPLSSTVVALDVGCDLINGALLSSRGGLVR